MGKTGRVAAALAAYGAAVLAFVLAYRGAERRFFFFDEAFYHASARDAAARLRESVGAWWAVVEASMAGEYNLAYHIPFAPALAWIDDSRTALVTMLALAYQLPYLLLAGAVCRAATVERRWSSFWLGAIVAALLPPVWPTVLQARPDIAASALIALAVLLWTGDQGLRRWRTALGIGLCLGLAVLLRRPYAYPTLAVCAVAGVSALGHTLPPSNRQNAKTPNASPLETSSSPRKRGSRRLLRSPGSRFRGDDVKKVAGAITRAASIAAVIVLILATLGGAYYRHRSVTEHVTLYSSYRRAMLDGLGFFVAEFGWLVLALALAGLVLGVRRAVLRRGAVAGLAAMVALWLATWLTGIGQVSTHRTIHILPLLVSVGLCGLILASPRRAWRIGLLALLVADFALAFLPLPTTPLHESAALARPRPPFRSPDYDTIAGLIGDLRRGFAGRPILVAASSRKLNDDMIRRGEQDLFGEQRLNVLWAPVVDSRDMLPWQAMREAELVIAATPAQYHLRADEQEVVRVVLDAFAEDWPWSRDFEALPAEYRLTDDILVRLYRRLRPTPPEVADDTLRRLLERISPLPGRQPPWVVLSSPHPGTLFLVDGEAAGTLRPPARLAPVPDAPAAIAGSVGFPRPDCPELLLTWRDLDGGTTLETTRLSPAAGTSFAFTPPPHMGRLALDVTAEGGPDCAVFLRIGGRR